MSDRLAELRRQRALIQEHLAWLDREIAAASGNAEAPALAPAADVRAAESAKTASLPGPALPTALPGPQNADLTRREESPEVEAAADAIIAEYRGDSNDLHTDVRKGCFLYFFAALAFVALGVAVLYLAFRR